MEPVKEPLKVRVTSITYNHAPYIRQCLDGFVMQKTNFRFEVVIHDDASTDGTDKIIREYAEKYPDIIKPIFEKENQYSKGGFALVSKAFIPYCKEYAKYIAQCEGDDFWTDPLKLQKQVDFLERNEDYGLVYTKVRRFIQRTNSYEGEWGKDCSYQYLLTHGSPIPTLSVCFRSNLESEYRHSVEDDPKWPLGDVPLWLYFMRYSKIKFLNQVMGVYRVLPESASHSKDYLPYFRFFNGAHLCRAYYAKRYWGDAEETIVQHYRISTIINDCIGLGIAPPIPLFKEMKQNKIYNVWLWIKCFIAYTRLSKFFYMNKPEYF